jgi:hypothetical protein
LALFSAFLAAIPLLVTSGLVSTRGGGDSPWLLARTYEMVQGLRAGQFPVRWMGHAAYGLGYPFFSFYSALPYYLAALLHLWGFGILWSIKLTQLIGFLAAAAGTYILAHRWLDSAPAAALVAIAYTFAPFHLSNVYVRGDSLSEFYAFVWYPLILLSLHRLFERPTAGRSGTLALTFAALVVTHNLSAMIFSPFVLLYVLLLIFDRPTQRRLKARAIGLTLLALALGVLLSAWYWLPALGELDAVQLGEEQTSGHFNYNAHFRSRDLVQPTAWFDYDPDVAPTPFAMGLVQAALTLAGTAALLWRWLRRRGADAPGLFALLALVIATAAARPVPVAVPLGAGFCRKSGRRLSGDDVASSTIGCRARRIDAGPRRVGWPAPGAPAHHRRRRHPRAAGIVRVFHRQYRHHHSGRILASPRRTSTLHFRGIVDRSSKARATAVGGDA